MAENARLIALGVGMDPNLMDEKLEEISQCLAKQIKSLVPTGYKAYVAAARLYRESEEVWACTTTRGGSKPLIHDEYGKRVNQLLLEAGGWRSELSLFISTNDMNVNRVEKRVHQILRGNPMSIWLVNGAGGVKKDNKGRMLRYSISLIYGPSTGFQFLADKRLGRPLSDHSNEESYSLDSSDEENDYLDSSDEEDEDDYDTKPPAIVQVTKPQLPFILEDDDVDDDTKPSAMKLATKRPPPLNDRLNDNSKPKAKVQQGLWGWTPLPKKPKPPDTYGLSSKPKKK